MDMREISLLLDKQGHRQYRILVLISILSSVAQTIGVASISLFFTVLLGGPLPRLLQQFLGDQDMVTLGVLVFAATLSGTASSALATYWGIKIAWDQYPKIACRLLGQYLQNDYEWHLRQSPAALAKTVITEAQSIVVNVLQQLVMVLVRGSEVLFIAAMLFTIRPLIAVLAFSTFGAIYVALFLVKRGHIRELGRQVASANTERHRAVNEALAGVKAVKVARTEDFFLGRFRAAAHKLSVATSSIQYFSAMPKYFIETVLFGGLVGFVVFSHLRGWDTSESIPLLALYGAAAIRLLPAIQQLYASFASLTGAQAALKNVGEGLCPQVSQLSEDLVQTAAETLFQFQGVCYLYPGTTEMVLKNISLTIGSGEKVGIVGATGAGKTTLVDILLGLLAPSSGQVSLAARSGRLVAYVPQQLHFIDDTIAANIALGELPSQRCLTRIETAARRAGIHDYIVSLPGSYGTCIGEQGVRLSGGQRQRIGIARALYSEPALLVLDEASNALDAETERRVINSLLDQDLTLLVIAHRISILRRCSRIVVMDKGEILAQGSFDELLQTNSCFRRLANADIGQEISF